MRASAFFLLIFLVATVLALFATYSAVSGIGPLDRSSPYTLWLLGANGVFILVLLFFVVARYRSLYRNARGAGGGTGAHMPRPPPTV